MSQTDIIRLVGGLFIAGFDGTEISPNICRLIEDHYVGAIIITPKNIINAAQATKLISDLQYTAYKAGHEYPLLIAIDQENGCCNSITDDKNLTQFPSAMGVVAGKDHTRARSIATATAKEIKCLGVNWILGPVLDVISNPNAQALGVRMMEEDPGIVAQFGIDFITGYHDGGVAACGKHFPSYGNLGFNDFISDIPSVSDTLEDMRRSAFIPFENAIRGGVDSIMVGACALPNFGDLDVQHACLSEDVVNNLLRQELRFPGVIVCECLEVESLHENLGFGQAAIMALSAGCDMLMVCNSYTNQVEAMQGVRMALENAILSQSQLDASARRILNMRRRYTNWSTALKPPGVKELSRMSLSHTEITRSAYESSMTLVRDTKSILPLPSVVNETDELLLFTPLLEPASFHINRNISEHEREAPQQMGQYMEGELSFRKLGLLLSKYWKGKVLHTSYAHSGIRPYHEDLILHAQLVIVVTADVGRNSYQYGFAKYVSMLCANATASHKHCIVVATSSPYDFLKDPQITTYICTYDYTSLALKCLTKVLFGFLRPTGVVPGNAKNTKASSRTPVRKTSTVWLTQQWDPSRDMKEVVNLLLRTKDIWDSYQCMNEHTAHHLVQETLIKPQSTIFIVKNTSTHSVYGICAITYMESIARGSIALLVVDPGKRNLGIGHSLHQRAVSHLHQQYTPKDIQIGSDWPALIPGLRCKIDPQSESPIMNWFANRGWAKSLRRQSIVLSASTTIRNIRLPPSTNMRWIFEVLDPDEQLDIASHSTKCLEPYTHTGNTLVRPEIVQDMYYSAIEASSGVDILIVHNLDTGSIEASALLYGQQSSFAKFNPVRGPKTAVLAGILIDPISDVSGVLSYLLSMVLERCHSLEYENVEYRLCDNYLDRSVFLLSGFEIVGEYTALYCESSLLVQECTM